MKLPRFFRCQIALLALCSFALLFTASAARAFSPGDLVTGKLTFNGDSTTNYFDPANHDVPTGYSNTAGSTVAISNSATEFGYTDFFNLVDTADFNTPGMLTLQDTIQFNSTFYTESFTGKTAGEFTGLVLVSSNFPTAPTFSVANDTLTINFPTINNAGTFTAVFAVASAVPEPSTCALLLGAGALLVGSWRTRRGAWARQGLAA